jgi:hypothetical protein
MKYAAGIAFVESTYANDLTLPNQPKETPE